MNSNNKPDSREASIRIRLTAEEKKELEEQAWRARKSVSAYIRALIAEARKESR